MPPTRRSSAPAQDSEWGEELGGGKLVKWDEPKVVIGEYEARDMVQGQYGLKPRVTLVADDGEALAFFPPSALDSRLQPIAFGTRIRIEYFGTTSKSKSGRDVKDFSVRAAKNGLHAQAFAGEIPA